jgi:two-component system response regulator ChvI
MTTQISIIDDNESILTSLSLQFQTQGYSTITFACPQKALEYHTKKPADAYIIDMRMPKLTGFQFYKRLCETQKKDRLPAIYLTAVDNLEEQALKNTTIGDFVLKPFSFKILLARLEKVLTYFTSKEKNKLYKVGNLEILEDQIMVRWFGKDVETTKREFAMINHLTRRPHVVFSRDQLLDICYGEDIILVDRNIDSHIKRIRKKFRKANPKEKFDRIKTHYGTGYSWNPKSVST